MLIGLGLTARDGVMLLLSGGAMIGAVIFVLNVADKIF
jgi:hypothetical protein